MYYSYIRYRILLDIMHISIACPTTPPTGSLGGLGGDLMLDARLRAREFDRYSIWGDIRMCTARASCMRL